MMGSFVRHVFRIEWFYFCHSQKSTSMDLIFTVILILSVYALNLYLIPIYGITGAAISTGSALVFYNTGRLLFVYFAFNLNPFTIRQVPIIVIALGVLYLGNIFSGLFENGIIQMSFQIVLVLSLFFTPIFVFNLEPESKAYIKNGLNYLKGKFRA